jgi:hypothetical protein
MRHCVTEQRMASPHEADSTTGVMVTQFQGYALPREIAVWSTGTLVWLHRMDGRSSVSTCSFKGR